MKISSITNSIITSFKGYDALPIKALHIAPSWGKIKEELQDISDKEKIELKESEYNQLFNQDFKVIIERNGIPNLIMQDNLEIMGQYKPKIEAHYGMRSEFQDIFDRSKGFISGGNFFLGKKPTGEKWMLIGSSEQRQPIDKKQIEKLYDVKEENIHFIQQQDYHLDLSIRPIGYPYVLINNPELSTRNEQKIRGENHKNRKSLEKQTPEMWAFKIALEQLKKAGFKPIAIGGIYGSDVNFINAIVNKHEDGSISYITNSSKCNNVFISKYQRQFEKDLKRKLEELKKTDPNVPELKSIYFVQGENFGDQNEVMENLIEGAGGVHCMCLEEPNFEAWI